MPVESHLQHSILAHLRHELRTPVNAIVGYSEMLLEDLQAENSLSLINELENIKKCGVQLLSGINSILNPAQQEMGEINVDIIILKETIRQKLETPLKVVMGGCDRILEKAVAELIPDIEKIRAAAEHLLNSIENIVNLSQQQSHFTEIQQSEQNQPIKKANEPTAFVQTQIGIDLLEENSNGKQTTGGKILVVDDNETNRDLLSRQIEGQGYTVAVAANGQQALQMIQTGEYDLILLDVIMPEMNGYQVLQWLQHSNWRHIPTIAISALDELDSVVKCIEMGAEDYLSKPFNPVLLRARINACLEKKRLRDREILYLSRLVQANQEISSLNERLKAENLRLSAELEVTRRLQQMILPKEKELSEIDELEIAGFMEPAEEVGGDYYDVLQHDDRVTISIGDVTGHGLESGVLMIMVQTALRTLIENDETDFKKLLEAINRTIYKNVQRMSSDKNLTLSLVDYRKGKVNLSGQHEEMIIVRSGGTVERIDTLDLGFPIGLEETIAPFLSQTQIQLNPGDIVILYTDGVTEAENDLGMHYGIERLCEVVKQNWQMSANEIREVVIKDLRKYIGQHKIYDDITLLVLKQK